MRRRVRSVPKLVRLSEHGAHLAGRTADDGAGINVARCKVIDHDSIFLSVGVVQHVIDKS